MDAFSPALRNQKTVECELRSVIGLQHVRSRPSALFEREMRMLLSTSESTSAPVQANLRAGLMLTLCSRQEEERLLRQALTG